MNNRVPPDDGDDRGHQNQNQTQTLKGDLALHGTIAIPQPEQSSSRNNHKNTNNSANYPFLNRFSVVASIGVGAALVVVGALQFGVYSRQAKIMKTQSGLIRDQDQLLRDANDLTKSIQRAFVTVSGMQQDRIVDQTGVKWWLTPIIENSGNTPTMITMVSVNPWSEGEVKITNQSRNANSNSGLNWHEFDYIISKVGSRDPDEIFDWSDEEKKSLVIKQVIGPHEKATPSLAAAGVTQVQLNTPQQTFLGNSFYGSIHYPDSFDGPDHITKYCFQIGLHVWGGGGLEPAISPCRHWNCYEASCAQDKAAYNREWAAAPRSPEEWAKQHGMHMPSDPPMPPSWLSEPPK